MKVVSDPIGTIQLVRMQLAGNFTWHKYRVIAATGLSKSAPSPDGPIIYMEAAERVSQGLDNFLTLPLSSFEGRVLCETKADKFWQDEKTIDA